MEDVLFTVVTGDAAVLAIIGTRMYPFAAPADAAVPYIVYRTFSAPREKTFGTTPPGNVHARVEFECRESTPAKARALGLAVKDVLHQYQGAGPPIIDGIYLENAWDDEGANVQDHRFARMQEYMVHHRE